MKKKKIENIRVMKKHQSQPTHISASSHYIRHGPVSLFSQGLSSVYRERSHKIYISKKKKGKQKEKQVPKTKSIATIARDKRKVSQAQPGPKMGELGGRWGKFLQYDSFPTPNGNETG